MTAAVETWKYVGSTVPATGSIADLLTALQAIGASATYYDGSARTPGSGVAGTWTSHLDTGVVAAVDLAPVGNTFSVRHLFAGFASAKAPTMGGGDSWTTSQVLYGLCRNVGAYSDWTAALPFTSGLFSGYMRCPPAGSIARVHLWECLDGAIIGWQVTASGRMYYTLVGELLDPGVNAATSPLSAEAGTNTRFYIGTSNQTPAVATWSTSGSNEWFYSGGGSNQPHNFVVGVGTVALVAVRRLPDTLALGIPALTADADFVSMPFWLVEDTAKRIYKMREIQLGPQVQTPLRATAAGVVKAYGVSMSGIAAGDAIWLQP